MLDQEDGDQPDQVPEPSRKKGKQTMDAYIYQADMLCVECGADKRRKLNEQAIAVMEANTGEISADRTYSRIKETLGFDPNNETTYDSGDYPKGPYANGGDESDSPEHCANCGVFLENPLTQDGRLYVIDQFVELFTTKDKDVDTLKTWFEFYEDDLRLADLGAAFKEVLRNKFDQED